MTKMLIGWMIFGCRLLSSFIVSAFYSFLKCLRYTADTGKFETDTDKFEKLQQTQTKQTQTSLKNYNSGLGF